MSCKRWTGILRALYTPNLSSLLLSIWYIHLLHISPSLHLSISPSSHPPILPSSLHISPSLHISISPSPSFLHLSISADSPLRQIPGKHLAQPSFPRETTRCFPGPGYCTEPYGTVPIPVGAGNIAPNNPSRYIHKYQQRADAVVPRRHPVAADRETPS